MKTLDEFLNRDRRFPNNEYVREPGFRELYVRDTLIDGRRRIEIARVEAKKTGKGAFTSLVSRLRYQYSCDILVECVQTERFEQLLIRLGFERLSYQGGFPSYLLKGDF